MRAIDLIRNTMRFIDRFAFAMAEDMRDLPLTQPTPRGGNHPLWVLGHLAVSEGDLTGMVRGDPNPLDDWKRYFDSGTEPSADASAYPPFDEVFGKFREMRARTMRLLEELHDADLDRAPRAPQPGFEEIIRTNADALMLIVIHQEFHFGQVADARRAAGRKPLFG